MPIPLLAPVNPLNSLPGVLARARTPWDGKMGENLRGYTYVKTPYLYITKYIKHLTHVSAFRLSGCGTSPQKLRIRGVRRWSAP